MKKADYSIASAEEREEVIAILQRNVNQLIEQKETANPVQLRKIVDCFSERIRNGDIVTGNDFEKLLLLLQKKPVD